MILGKGGRVGHAEHGLVPFDRRLRVLAAVGGVVNAAEFDRTGHSAGSFSTASALRRIWSSSIDLKSAVKLPSPKPSSFLRWMNSKKTGPITVWPKIWSSSRGSPSVVEPASRMQRASSSAHGSPWRSTERRAGSEGDRGGTYGVAQ